MAKEIPGRLQDQRKAAVLKSGMAEFSHKSYADASTDEITKSCGISKGLLFHYFGSKRAFYFHCLEQALIRLCAVTPETCGEDFYGVIFSAMDEKFRLCREYPDEARLLNMAARETGGEVQERKNSIIAAHLTSTRAESAKTMARAVSMLRLKSGGSPKVTAALALYTGALVNRYMEEYRERPGEFFEKADDIKAELKEYIDFMLHGVVRED